MKLASCKNPNNKRIIRVGSKRLNSITSCKIRQLLIFKWKPLSKIKDQKIYKSPNGGHILTTTLLFTHSNQKVSECWKSRQFSIFSEPPKKTNEWVWSTFSYSLARFYTSAATHLLNGTTILSNECRSSCESFCPHQVALRCWPGTNPPQRIGVHALGYSTTLENKRLRH